jgi:WD40 repeat protein
MTLLWLCSRLAIISYVSLASLDRSDEVRPLPDPDPFLQSRPRLRLGAIAENAAASDSIATILSYHQQTKHTGEELKRFGDKTGWVESVVFTKDGKQALAVSGEIVRLWDVETGKELKSFDGHAGGVNSVALTPDGRLAASGGYDGKVRLWDVKSGDELHRFRGHAN